MHDHSHRPAVAVATATDELDVLFPHAAPETLAALASAGREFELERRQRILREDGEPRVALLHDGYAGTWRTDAEGRAQLVSLSGPGDLGGLLALGPHRRAIDLVALTPVRATVWPADDVLRLVRADAGLGTDMLDHALHLGERLLTRLEHLGFDSVSRRLARLLWQRREVLFDARRPLLTRPQLADLAGATREMVDRVLRELEADGVVRRLGRGGLVLLDPAGLEERAALEGDEPECS